MMNYRDVTLCKMALASFMYDSLTSYNKSLRRLDEATGRSIDLSNVEHRKALIKWLNDWGCRHLSKKYHEVASDNILNWYDVDGTRLFTDKKPLWELGDDELEVAVNAYGSLKDKTGAWRDRGGRKQEVPIGEVAASKILFAIRRRALMPWDNEMQRHFQCDGNPKSYRSYLRNIKELTLHIGSLCRNKGFQIDDLPAELGRPESTVLELINEYVWITVPRKNGKKIELPSSRTVARWAALG